MSKRLGLSSDARRAGRQSVLTVLPDAPGLRPHSLDPPPPPGGSALILSPPCSQHVKKCLSLLDPWSKCATDSLQRESGF